MGKIFRKIGNCLYIGDWYVGWHDWSFGIYYDECGYEDGNGELHIDLLGWHSVFTMPWKSKRLPYGDCDAPRYGIAVQGKAFWLYKGGNGNMDGGNRFIMWDLPFTYSVPCINHRIGCVTEKSEIVMVPFNQIRESKDENGRHVAIEDNERVCRYTKTFTDKYDGTMNTVTYWYEDMEWRPKWLGWTKLFSKVRRYAEMVFKKEVGAGKNTWKGGTTGAAVTIMDGETIHDAVDRWIADKENYR